MNYVKKLLRGGIYQSFKFNNGGKVNIFTDDEDWVKNQKLFNSAKNIFGENSFNNNPLSTFANMTKYNNFIVGNSTFSLLAAFLKEDTSSKIIELEEELGYESITPKLSFDGMNSSVTFSLADLESKVLGAI